MMSGGGDDKARRNAMARLRRRGWSSTTDMRGRCLAKTHVDRGYIGRDARGEYVTSTEMLVHRRGVTNETLVVQLVENRVYGDGTCRRVSRPLMPITPTELRALADVCGPDHAQTH